MPKRGKHERIPERSLVPNRKVTVAASGTFAASVASFLALGFEPWEAILAAVLAAVVAFVPAYMVTERP